MAEQAAQGDVAVGGSLVGMKARAYVELPQGVLDRGVEGQALLLHQLQGGGGGQQFGEGAGAERGVGGDGFAQGLVGQAKALGPDQFLAVDQGDGQAGYVLPGHFAGNAFLQVADDCAVVALGNGRRGRRLAVAAEAAQQATQQRNTAQCAKHDEHPRGGLDARMLGAGRR